MFQFPYKRDVTARLITTRLPGSHIQRGHYEREIDGHYVGVGIGATRLSNSFFDRGTLGARLFVLTNSLLLSRLDFGPRAARPFGKFPPHATA